MAAAVAVHEGLFTTDADGAPRLIGARCANCGRHQFPHSSLCPYCGADDVAEVLLSVEGTLWAWTAVTAPPPGYRGDVPYGFGVVELPEGVRVLTRLTESDPARLRFGQDVRLHLVRLHTDDEGRDVLTWAFG
ncbi:MAG: Zn-ribbon domain-containing OB-fold protein [Acidimicrobiia bacterium]|nr:Zn-ribbon domain-containing OB-fold protein [Acidimicrobiia bacterium]